MNGWVVDEVDARLTWYLDGRLHLLLLLLHLLLKLLELLLLLLLLSVVGLLLLLLRSHVSLVERTHAVQGHALSGSRDVGKLLLQLLLALSQIQAVHLHLLEDVGVDIFLLVHGGRSQDLLRERIHLTTSSLGVLRRRVKAGCRSSRWHLLAISIVALVCPLSRVGARHGMLSLMVRSGSWDGMGLGLSAKTCEQVRAAGAWSWTIDRVLTDGGNPGRECYAQPLGVLALAPSTTEAGTGKAKTAGREAVVGVVIVSHLSNAACANAHCADGKSPVVRTCVESRKSLKAVGV